MTRDRGRRSAAVRPRSARFAGEDASDERNLAELIRALSVPASGQSARYRCVAVLAWPDGEELSTEGVCEGILEPKPRGTRGFGYDPIFVPAGWDLTMAELSDDEKDRIATVAGPSGPWVRPSRPDDHPRTGDLRRSSGTRLKVREQAAEAFLVAGQPAGRAPCPEADRGLLRREVPRRHALARGASSRSSP